MELPVELWLDIVERSAKGDLKALRQVCKISNSAATPLLFRSVYVSDNSEVIEKVCHS